MGITPVFISLGNGGDMFDACGGVPRQGDLVNVSKPGGTIPPGRYVVSAVEWKDHMLPVLYLNAYV